MTSMCGKCMVAPVWMDSWKVHVNQARGIIYPYVESEGELLSRHVEFVRFERLAFTCCLLNLASKVNQASAIIHIITTTYLLRPTVRSNRQ